MAIEECIRQKDQATLVRLQTDFKREAAGQMHIQDLRGGGQGPSVNIGQVPLAPAGTSPLVMWNGIATADVVQAAKAARSISWNNRKDFYVGEGQSLRIE